MSLQNPDVHYCSGVQKEFQQTQSYLAQGPTHHHHVQEMMIIHVKIHIAINVPHVPWG